VDAELDRVDPAGVLDGQLFLHLGRERVHGHAEMVTSDAAQRDVIDRAVGALQREAFRDLGGDAAVGTRDDGWHCSALPRVLRDYGLCRAATGSRGDTP
jgi:hypothetical protein